MRELKYIITLQFSDGKLDTELLESNVRFALEKAISEGAITPDHDDHATLIGSDVTPC